MPHVHPLSLLEEDFLLQSAMNDLNILVWRKDVRTGETRFFSDCFMQLYQRPKVEFELNPTLLAGIVHADEQLDYLLFLKPMKHKDEIDTGLHTFVNQALIVKKKQGLKIISGFLHPNESNFTIQSCV